MGEGEFIAAVFSISNSSILVLKVFFVKLEMTAAVDILSFFEVVFDIKNQRLWNCEGSPFIAMALKAISMSSQLRFLVGFLHMIHIASWSKLELHQLISDGRAIQSSMS